MIALEQVWKRFRLYRRPLDRLWEAVSGRPRHHWHTALAGVNLEVRAGETLAILGRNGAGKSTLLKLVTGVLLPDEGTVRVDGRVTGLLELGTGFDPRLSGRRNIHVNGLLLGMTLEEIRTREASIIAFAELGRYIDEPLKTYSSGMVMRLGFAIAIHADPACLVVDEALSVGDARFQQKCLSWIRAFRQRGGAILFTSHDLNAVKLLADRAVVLEGGKALYTGSPDEATAFYLRTLAAVDEALAAARGYGSGEVVIEAVELTGVKSKRPVLSCGETARLTLTLKAREDVAEAVVGFMIRDRFGQDLFGTNGHLLGRTLALEAGRRYRLTIELEMLLHPGRYTVTVAVHRGPHHLETCYHWWDGAVEFEVAGVLGPLFSGVCRLPVKTFECEESEVNVHGVG